MHTYATDSRGEGGGIEANHRPYYYSLWLVIYIYEFDTSTEKCTYFDTVDQEFGVFL